MQPDHHLSARLLEPSANGRVSPLTSALTRVARMVADEQQRAYEEQQPTESSASSAWWRRGQRTSSLVAPATTTFEGAWLLEMPVFPPLLVRPPCWLVTSTCLFTAAVCAACVWRRQLAPLVGLGHNPDYFMTLLLSYLSIPLVSVVFTYFHIWLALWMTFFPTRFFGCWQLPWSNLGFPLGWQGIVPWKGREMGRRACRLMLAHIMSVDEMLGRLDPEGLTAAMGEPMLHRIATEAVDAAALEVAPRVWARLPARTRESVYAAARASTPAVVRGLLADLRADHQCGRGFDLERLVDRVFVGCPRLVSAMFIQCGWSELVFIRNMGATMGGVLGLLQMGVYAVYRPEWLLPAFGFLAGTLTNWVALALIFYPFYPVALCPPWRWTCCCCGGGSDDAAVAKARAHPHGCCIMQGLFIRRQVAVAAVYARIVANALVTPNAILEEVLLDEGRLREHCRQRTLEATDAVFDGPSGEGASSSSWLALAKRALELADRVGVAVGGGTTASPVATHSAETSRTSGLDDGCSVSIDTPRQSGTTTWDSARQRAANVACRLMPDALRGCSSYVREAMRLEETLRERIAVLPPEEFEELLHSVFKEDEWKLFAVGGALGAGIGIAQQYAFCALGIA